MDKPFTAYTLILNTSIYFLATGLYAVIMPLLSTEFSLDNSTIQYTLALYQVATVVACFVAGLYADAFGKRNFLILSLAALILGGVACLFATDITLLAAGRFLQGFGAAAVYIISIALINEIYGKKGSLKVFSLMALVSSSFFTLSIFISGMLSYYTDWHSVFIYIIGVAGIILWGSFRYVPDTSNEKKSNSFQQIMNHYRTFLKDRKFKIYIIFQPFFISLTWFTMAHTTFYFQQKLQLTSSQYGIVFSLIILAFGLGGKLSVRIMQIVGIDNTIKIGILFYLMGIFMLTMLHFYDDSLVVWITLALFIQQMGFGLMTPTSLSVVLNIYPELSTSASVFRTLLVTIASYIGSQLATMTDETSLLSLVSFLFAAWCLLFFIFSLRKEHIR